MDNKRPKRRKDKDNPYTVLYRDGKAYIMFEDGQKIEQLVEVDDKLFQLFNTFELEDLRHLNIFDRHIEHAWVSEKTLYRRSEQSVKTAEDEAVWNILKEDLYEAIIKLPETQRRRLILRYFFDFTYNFSVEQGEFVGIMGKSGCGKTTLLKVLGMIDKQTDGVVRFMEKDTSKLYGDELADIRREQIGFVFQDFYLMDSLSVEENIMLPMILGQEKVDVMTKAAKKYAEQFQISHLLKKNPYELSGGEKQRVAICRALINDPDLILDNLNHGDSQEAFYQEIIGRMADL